MIKNKKPFYMQIQFIIAVAGSLLVFFFNLIIQDIELNVNKADLKIKYFEGITQELSEILFFASASHEILSKNFFDQVTLNQLQSAYNNAYINFYKNVIFNKMILSKLWNDKTVTAYDIVVHDIDHIDQDLHALNPLLASTDTVQYAKIHYQEIEKILSQLNRDLVIGEKDLSQFLEKFSLSPF